MCRLRSLVVLTTLLTAVSILAGVPSSAVMEVVKTIRVSVASDGTQANGTNSLPSLSADGGLVVYSSYADNLVAGDTNGENDVFMYNVSTGTTTRVSVASDGTQANDGSHAPGVSADGSTVVYHSWASNLVDGDTNDTGDVFMYNVSTGTTTRVSVASDGTQANEASDGPAVSGDGQTIVYGSEASNLVDGDTNDTGDVFMYNVSTGTTTRVSVASDGTESSGYRRQAISADGNFVVYHSHADNLVADDANNSTDVFMYDVATGTTARVSVAPGGAESNGGSWDPAISADGALVVFQSSADNLVADDTNNSTDVFMFDVETATTVRVNVTSDGAQASGGHGNGPAISADGSLVVFQSGAYNLVAGDTNHLPDVFVHKVATGATTRVSVATDGTQGNGWSEEHTAISGDGSTVAYSSAATTLVDGDTNGVKDVFITTLGYDPFDDDDSSIFENDIEWLALQGITSGCHTRAFCPADNVTRGQIAAFLVRALNLPDTTDDYFTDDTNSIFQDDINRLAESGITTGCTPTTYCPADSVTRGQMAAFLARAFNLPDTTTDYFTDDTNSIFQNDINRLAESGITTGCTPTTYCPADQVTRGQMAAFLKRALD